MVRVGTPAYTTRSSRFTLSGDTAATNESTTGVTVINAHSVAFVTGENTANGYVARWTGIDPGSDGTIVIRAEADTTVYQAYAFSAFMLSEEVPSGPTITTSGTLNDFNAAVGGTSDQQTYTVSGVNLTDPIVITAPSDFQVSTTSGSGFASSLSLTPTSGTVASTPIYVRLVPTTTTAYSANISHTASWRHHPQCGCDRFLGASHHRRYPERLQRRVGGEFRPANLQRLRD